MRGCLVFFLFLFLCFLRCQVAWNTVMAFRSCSTRRSTADGALGSGSCVAGVATGCLPVCLAVADFSAQLVCPGVCGDDGRGCQDWVQYPRNTRTAHKVPVW